MGAVKDAAKAIWLKEQPSSLLKRFSECIIRYAATLTGASLSIKYNSIILPFDPKDLEELLDKNPKEISEILTVREANIKQILKLVYDKKIAYVNRNQYKFISFNNERRNKIIELHKLGFSNARIAKELETTRQNIHQYMSALNLTPNKKLKLSDILRNDIKILLEQGFYFTEIAKKLKCSIKVINKVVKDIEFHKETLKSQIIRLHKQGLTDKEIANQLGTRITYVSNTRYEVGLPCNKSSFYIDVKNPSFKDSLLKEIKDGTYLTDLSRKFNATPNTILKYVEKNDLPMPTKQYREKSKIVKFKTKLELRDQIPQLEEFLIDKIKTTEVKEIAKELNTTVRNIYQLLRHFKIQYNQPKRMYTIFLSKMNVDRIIELRKQGLTYIKIAKELQIPVASFFRIKRQLSLGEPALVVLRKENYKNKYCGVSINRRFKNFIAKIRFNKKVFEIGSYKTAEEAAAAVNAAYKIINPEDTTPLNIVDCIVELKPNQLGRLRRALYD